MSGPINYDRRRFIGTTMMTIAGAGLVWSRLWESEPRKNGSRREVKQIDEVDLNVGYAEAGPSNGPAIILLHRSPREINSCIDIMPLAAGGYRVIVPPVALDVIRLMDTLKIEKALVGGFDRASRTAVVMAERWPQRLKAIAPVSGYNVVNIAASQRPLPPKAELGWWYQYYFVRNALVS